MEKISRCELKSNSNSKPMEGSFGKVIKVNFDGKTYAYKFFKNPEYFAHIKEKIILMADTVNIPGINLPTYLVGNNGYLTPWAGESSIASCMKKPATAKRELKNLSKVIKALGKINLLHGDIRIPNIAYCPNSNPCSTIIDFDNASYKGFEFCHDFAAIDAHIYIKKFGIETLDTYMFNIVTFCILNNIFPKELKSKITSEDFGVFTQPKAKTLCKNFYTKPHHQFLIDTYK
ncbi:MAG: hypothetical protein Q4G04_05515 [bacterium]|nr:hypothetical protein [bacterium]